MSRIRLRPFHCSLLAVMLLSCGGDIPRIPTIVILPASLVIENRSQYEIQELRLHQQLEYEDAENVLDEPFVVGEKHVFHGLGSWNVTVFREKNRGGPVIAVSTLEPVALKPNEGYGLLVFDESFRVESRPWMAETSTASDAPPL